MIHFSQSEFDMKTQQSVKNPREILGFELFHMKKINSFDRTESELICLLTVLLVFNMKRKSKQDIFAFKTV